MMMMTIQDEITQFSAQLLFLLLLSSSWLEPSSHAFARRESQCFQCFHEDKDVNDSSRLELHSEDDDEGTYNLNKSFWGSETSCFCCFSHRLWSAFAQTVAMGLVQVFKWWWWRWWSWWWCLGRWWRSWWWKWWWWFHPNLYLPSCFVCVLCSCCWKFGFPMFSCCHT